MLRTITAGLLASAAIAFAAPAMAVGPTTLQPTGQVNGQNYGVPVEIEVEESVSIWAGAGQISNPPPITLDMNGADGNNSATEESTITYITNVDANVQAKVDGTLPAPIVPGGGINFFLFRGYNAAAAVAQITLNAYNPVGALAWNYNNLGASQQLIASTGINTSAETDQLTYASASPGELPLPNTYNLTVTYTIAAN